MKTAFFGGSIENTGTQIAALTVPNAWQQLFPDP
jgi:hypothetical protein